VAKKSLFLYHKKGKEEGAKDFSPVLIRNSKPGNRRSIQIIGTKNPPAPLKGGGLPFLYYEV
jgi:hypothetical protein